MDRGQWTRMLGASLSALLLAGVAQAGHTPERAQPQRELMYTLTVTFIGQEDERQLDSQGRVSGEISRLTTYVARTVRAFALSRLVTGSTTSFDFEAELRGPVTHTGSGWQHLGAGCYLRITEASRSVQVEGTVSPSRTRPDPSPLYVDIDPKPSSRAVTRSHEPSGCDPSAKAYEDSVSTLLPQAPRWNGPLEFVYTKPANLSRSFGRPFTISHRDRHTRVSDVFGARHKEAVRSYLWLLTFIPVRPVEVERWQVEVRGEDTWSWGRTATIGAGVRVEWLHRTDLTIDDGKVTKAKSKVTVEQMRPFSTPDGAFTVSRRAKTYPAYTTKKAVKRGTRVELGLWQDPGSTYRVDFTVELAGPQALEIMRAAGVPDPEAVYKSIGKPVESAATPLVPFSSRLVVKLVPGSQSRETEAFSQRPCTKGATKKECFLRRGGETVVVRPRQLSGGSAT